MFPELKDITFIKRLLAQMLKPVSLLSVYFSKLEIFAVQHFGDTFFTHSTFRSV